MDPPPCTHDTARRMLRRSDPEGALCAAGPVLEGNPSDVAAWRIVAWAVLELGDRPLALKNLKSVCLALAEEGNPILALSEIKSIAEFVEDVGDLVEKLSAMYGKGSDRVEEVDIAPPPLPIDEGTEPWDRKAGREALLSKASGAMAMAWGASLAEAEKRGPLPYLSLFSALDGEAFTSLFDALERQAAEPGALVVRQGDEGDSMYVVAEGAVAVRHRPHDGEPVVLAHLGPGAFFGEMSLLSNAPRAAEVVAEEHTVLLRADKPAMEDLAERIPEVGDVLVAFCHARMLENLMRISPVLAPVPPASRPDVIARFTTGFYRAGEVIIEQDAEGRGLFLIVSGTVQVTGREDGEEVFLARLGPGDLFGEISLVMRKRSTATVTAAENTALLFLDRDDFNKATDEFPGLLKGAFDIAVARESQNVSIMGQPAAEADDLVMV